MTMISNVNFYKSIPVALAAIAFANAPEASSIQWIKYSCYFTIPLFFVGVAWAYSLVSRFTRATTAFLERDNLVKFAEGQRDCFIVDMILLVVASSAPMLSDGEALESPYFWAILAFASAQMVFSYMGILGFSKIVERSESFSFRQNG